MADGDGTRRQREVHLSYRVDYDLDRVRGFSDCVFGVAITIVVITFVLPDRGATDSQLASDLLGEWPRYLSYLAAFAVIGYTWVTHHQVFEAIRRVDTTTVWINLALLAFIVLLPYPMQLLGQYYDLSLPYVMFNLDAFLFGLLNWLIVAYATKDNRLVARFLPPETGRVLRLRAAVFPAALGLATLLAVPFGAWSILAWVLIPLGRAFVRSLGAVHVGSATGDDFTESETVRRAEQLESESRRAGQPVALASVFAESGSLSRLVGFSDNVYAFAITLLVLQFTLPNLSSPVDSDALREALVDQLQPDLIGFFVGFAVIGLFWTIHHRDFLIIERQDAGLRALNLVHLMFIAVMPFATLVISTYDGFVSATVLYAVCAGLASISLFALLFYATHDHRLVDPGIPWHELRERRVLGMIAPTGFLVSIPVAFASPYLAQVVWLTPFVGTRVFRVRHSRRERGQLEG